MKLNRKFYFGVTLIGLFTLFSFLAQPQGNTSARINQSSTGNEQIFDGETLLEYQSGPSQASDDQPKLTTTANGERMVEFPANSLNFDETSTIITQTATGLLWQANYQNGAFLIIPRPDDWDGVSDVTMHLFFMPTTSTPGNVEFFIRPRAYDPGDQFADIINVDSTPVPVSQANQVKEQMITIPASRFGDKKLWVISIQREGADATYPDDVTLLSVALSYAPGPSSGTQSYGIPANALNFDETSTIITGFATGLRWQANFQNPAYLIIPRPDDWDGVSDVTMHLFFTPTTGTPGNVEFFIRPRAYDPDDQFGDIINLDSTPVPVSQVNQIREQMITIPASRFGDKKLWVITIQREGAGATYADDVTLLSVSLSYSTIPFPASASFSSPGNGLNYSAASTIITGFATGLRWQANFQNPAFLIIPRPDDWDGVSDVTMHLFFTPTTSTPGNVEFFIRPRAYDPDDQFGDIINLDSTPVPVSQANQVKEQMITIPASRFGNKKLWVITIQREGAGATYTDDVTLYASALSYDKLGGPTYLPIVINQ